MARFGRRGAVDVQATGAKLLPSATRLWLVGSACALALAVGLGAFIPHEVGHYLLRSEFDADRGTLNRLLRVESVPPRNEQETQKLDSFVRNTVLAGDYVRVKLWSPDGRVLYSDEPRLVGSQFVATGPLLAAIRGRATQDVSRLDESENVYERNLGRRLLELYLPIKEHGNVVAVWEVYRSLDRTDAAMGRIRQSVRVSVGLALAVLFACLAFSFRGMLGAIRRRRDESRELARHLSAVLGVSRAVATSLDAEELTAAAVDAVARESSFDSVAVVRRGAAGDEILAERGPTVHADDPGALTVGIHADELDLILVAGHADGRAFSPCEEMFLSAAADELGVALGKAHLYERLELAEAEQRRLTHRLFSSTEDERKRIVGEIHDGLGQDLHRVLYGLRGSRSVPWNEADEELAHLEGLVEDSIRRLRRLLQELRPSTLDDVGLAASLRSLGDRFGTQDGLDVEVVDQLDREPAIAVRVAIFRIVQEALRNTVKHASARSARVELSGDAERVVVRVVDDGTGYRDGGNGDNGDGLGVWLMQERAAAVGGGVTIRGDRGTSVEVRVPVEAPA